MFSKILVFAAALAVVSCHQPYPIRKLLQRQQHQQYRHPYEHEIRVQPEPSSSEEYKFPESHGHGFSAHSLHQGLASYQASHDSSEHIAPVYEHGEAILKHEVPKKYQVQYPVPAIHEVKTVRVPAHHKAPEHYQPESHEAYHHEESHESHESHDEPIDYYAYPKYQYEYKVEDPHTGDNKFQHEYRDGDVVKGVYGLHEADGSIRTVEYSSDKHHGFTAIVKHSAPGQHVHIESHHEN